MSSNNRNPIGKILFDEPPCPLVGRDRTIRNMVPSRPVPHVGSMVNLRNPKAGQIESAGEILERMFRDRGWAWPPETEGEEHEQGGVA